MAIPRDVPFHMPWPKHYMPYTPVVAGAATRGGGYAEAGGARSPGFMARLAALRAQAAANRGQSVTFPGQGAGPVSYYDSLAALRAANMGAAGAGKVPLAPVGKAPLPVGAGAVPPGAVGLGQAPPLGPPVPDYQSWLAGMLSGAPNIGAGVYDAFAKYGGY